MNQKLSKGEEELMEIFRNFKASKHDCIMLEVIWHNMDKYLSPPNVTRINELIDGLIEKDIITYKQKLERHLYFLTEKGENYLYGESESGEGCQNKLNKEQKSTSSISNKEPWLKRNKEYVIALLGGLFLFGATYFGFWLRSTDNEKETVKNESEKIEKPISADTGRVTIIQGDNNTTNTGNNLQQRIVNIHDSSTVGTINMGPVINTIIENSDSLTTNTRTTSNEKKVNNEKSWLRGNIEFVIALLSGLFAFGATYFGFWLRSRNKKT